MSMNKREAILNEAFNNTTITDNLVSSLREYEVTQIFSDCSMSRC